MKKILITACACLGISLSLQAQTLYWDGEANDGLWCNNVNWGNQSGPDPSLNMLPTEFNTILFRDISPGGDVQVTCDAIAARIRLTSASIAWTVAIGTNEVADRTLTLSGRAAEYFDNFSSVVPTNLTISGAPNAGGFKLKLQMNDFNGRKPFNVDKAGSLLTVSCDISGTGGFDKTGAGTAILSGVNTYTSNTTVSAGTLLVNNPGSISAASPVTVNSGGTLGGDGTINSVVTINDGGTLAPGASIGTLALGSDLILAGNLLIEVDKSVSPSNDVTTVSGILTNAGSGTVTVTNLGPVLVAGDSFQLFDKPVLNGEALNIVSAGGEVWTNKLAVDGSIAVLSVAVPPSLEPIITSIDGAGTTTVTINYTNTIAGTDYVVQYQTNFAGGTWTDLSPVTAGGTTSFATDNPPAGDAQRYYRVYYVTP